MGHEQFQTVEYILFIVKCVHEYVGITKYKLTGNFVVVVVVVVEEEIVL